MAIFCSLFLASTLVLFCQASEKVSGSDPDEYRPPPEDIVIGLKSKESAVLSSGYLWRMANRLHLSWEAQKPDRGDEDQWFEIEFFLYPDGSVSDVKFADTKLDANGKKAIRAFLETVPFESWSESARKLVKDRVTLTMSMWLKAKKPNKTPEPTR